ncbi:MAG: single-stranded-DNA-specific exonuclease RecJ, partial [Miltoncostaeaceae bacterium]
MGWRAARVPYAEVVRLRDELDVPEPVAWTLARRGMSDPARAREFLEADGPLAPPDDIPGVPEAAERLMRAISAGERVVVHGDYDCDGVTSTALMSAAIGARGGQVRPFLPSRFEDGYGVSEATVRRLAEEGCDLLVCVDCGTTAVEELSLATELGLDVLVCDHHLAAGRRPPGILVNPALGPSRDDLPAAAGVVFAITRAMVALDAGGIGPGEEDGIDLVALATVADAVPLVGENRRLVARGLAALRAAPRPGIAALAGAAGSDPRAMTARGLGFTLGPAINAAGRMTHAEEALALLVAEDQAAARPVADRLWSLNEERRQVERAIVEEAVAIVEAEPPERQKADALVVVGDGWHEGVVGIVASRMVDRFERPAIVLSRDGEVAKGSGRSLPGVDLHALVESASEGLTRWGG